MFSSFVDHSLANCSLSLLCKAPTLSSFSMGKNKAYNTGINTKVITVPTSNPPIIVTAREPNKSSPSKGIIPRIVVKEAIITGRKREDDESSKATNLPLPEAICKVISSSNTTPFLIIIPINPKAPTIATKPKSFSSRATRQAVRPSRAATGTSRRSCRCAVRS